MRGKDMKRYTEYLDPSDIVSARRSELSLLQTELAKLLGYKNANFISILEKGKSKIPLDDAGEIARVLEMDEKWFIERCMRQRFPRLAANLFGPNEEIDAYWKKMKSSDE